MPLLVHPEGTYGRRQEAPPDHVPPVVRRRRSDVRGESLGGFSGLEYRRMRRIGLPMWFFGLLAMQTEVPAPSLHLIEWFSAFCVVDPTRSFMLRYPFVDHTTPMPLSSYSREGMPMHEQTYCQGARKRKKAYTY